MAILPSPPPDASATQRGLVSLSAQTFAGAKTFTSTLIASAGVQTGLVFNTNGTGASDRIIKAGTTQSYAAANASAKLFSLWYGIGGTEVEHFTVDKNGVYFNGYPASSISCSGSWIDVGQGLPVRTSSYFASSSPSNSTAYYASGNGAFSGLNTFKAWSETAAGATDVAVKLGCYVADGSVNATTKLLSLVAGMSGTEVESLSFLKGGRILGGAGAGELKMDGVTGSRLQYGTLNYLSINSFSVASRSSGVVIAESTAADGATAQALYVNATNSWVNAGARLLALNIQDTAKFAVNAYGRVSINGTSSAAGAATIDKPAGVSGIAAGASSVVITNSLVTASSHILITPHTRDATCKELIVTRAAGSFTVSGTANATANLFFSWEVKEII